MSKAEETSRLIGGLIAAILLALFFAVAGVYINSVSNTPCAVLNNCTEIKLYMKVPLIATHLLPFALFPFAMLVFWLRAPQLERLKAISPFSSILGFAFFMVSMTGEIGWHVGQHWFYKEEYNIMNFVFYVFFMFGIGFWAKGLQLRQSAPKKDILSELENVLLFISPLVVTLVYGAAATSKAKCPESVASGAPGLALFNICSWFPSSKVPIYILMALEFVVLTRRLYKVLDSDYLVFLVPFFSVGVNLFFIFLLGQNVENQDIIKNPLYHILHDLVGTELGVFIATLLVWSKTREPQESWNNRKSE